MSNSNSNTSYDDSRYEELERQRAAMSRQLLAQLNEAEDRLERAQANVNTSMRALRREQQHVHALNEVLFLNWAFPTCIEHLLRPLPETC